MSKLDPEWYQLILIAKNLGLDIEEVRQILENIKEEK